MNIIINKVITLLASKIENTNAPNSTEHQDMYESLPNYNSSISYLQRAA